MKTPIGFLFAGGAAGIKVNKKDLALIVSERPAVAAGCFTQSKSRAASIDWNVQHLPSDHARAIVSNSGNANCMTGEAGLENNRVMAAAIAEGLGVPVGSVLTCSTGVIGVQLPVKKIVAAAPQLIKALGPDPMTTAEAILTTDLVTKTSSREIFLGEKRVRVLGVAKGSGMIHPNMATMLAFVVTDAAIAPAALDAILRQVTDDTFNMVSVDRDTSTNDAVIVMANGMAENARVTDVAKADAKLFADALGEVCRDLARAIAADGEGANHLLTVRVVGAESRAMARDLAKSVIESNLTKAAFFGADPNWGRVLAAMGARAHEKDYRFVPAAMTVKLQETAVFANGAPTAFDADALRVLLRAKEVLIDVDLGLGGGEPKGGFSAVAWGCDLSYDYVRINADYCAVLEEPEGLGSKPAAGPV